MNTTKETLMPDDINHDLEHDDARGAEQTTATESPTVALADEPAATLPATLPATLGADRAPGFYYDDPNSLCDTPGHVLAE
jgi:hypothetical protein